MQTAQPVAAALRERGEWNIDAPALPLDADVWWYRFRFDAPQLQAGERVALRFEGLAGIARIRLNGEELGASDNMFTATQFEVGALLREHGNELLLRFDALDALLARRRPRPRWRVPMLVAQQLRWFRTTLLGRTPGWSPTAPVVGPWRDVLLMRGPECDAAEVRITASIEGDDGVVRCTSHGGGLKLRIEGHGAAIEAQGREPCLRVPGAKRWWPHTHGEPALYTVTVVDRDGRIVTRRRIGFRTISLDTGGGFALRVNGVPVFCRGACWTPMDAVSLRSSAQDCAAAISQVRSAGMNMLRVAGTMAYEEDHFYEACDEQGVLVWQDFMFANMDYPAQDGAFMASAAQEATQQLRRWGWRPAIAVACGNSEVEQQAAMWGAPRGQWKSPLFDEMLPALCAEHAPGVPYWPSSAHGGAVPFQADTGTTSYYGVGAYLRPLEDARRSGLRFATECLAFANVPSDEAIARMPGGLGTRSHHPQWKARVPRDLGAGWDFEDVRDHYLRELTGLDAVKLRYADHARYLALSRWVSGEVMAAAFSEWRRPGSSCAGALVLMLRDLWAGAGWGLLDERGAPKACWHALANVLQPRAVLLTDEGGNGLAAHVLNETEEALDAVLTVNAWQGQVSVADGRLGVPLPPRGARSIPVLEALDHFIDLNHAYRFGPAPCDCVAVALHDGGGGRVGQAVHFPRGYAHLLAQDPDLAASVRMLDARTAEVTVASRRVALGVHFEAPGFTAQREWFHLAPGDSARVVLRASGEAHFHGFVHALNAPSPAGIVQVP